MVGSGFLEKTREIAQVSSLCIIISEPGGFLPVWCFFINLAIILLFLWCWVFKILQDCHQRASRGFKKEVAQGNQKMQPVHFLQRTSTQTKAKMGVMSI